ncbi:unnamed protein product [Schistocephalus solidus]|uniref:CCR4-NOT transcription complex subunit 11 n=1 Tax=Schistocephalus solidus TaxID=70667 RepID=A0A183SZL1_SCHSO|nr:unnamed protein product [Schistocephalus solidus]
MPSQQSHIRAVVGLCNRHPTGSRVVSLLISFLIFNHHLPAVCAMSRGQLLQGLPDEQRAESPIQSLASKPSLELDLVCGPHPFDLLISSILRTLKERSVENNLVIANAMTSLYRTQPKFYTFVMKCTSAWNRCQREQEENGLLEKLTGAESTLPTQPNDWQILCGRGLSL